jgi:hypothetical protein
MPLAKTWRELPARTSQNSVKAKFAECGFSALGPSFFDGTVPAQTRAHRSDGKCHRGFAYTTCCSPQPLVARQCQGRSFGIVYCLRTADKALDTNIVDFSFLRDLQENQRADERTRTAYPCSLRVVGQALQGFAEGCKHRISKRVSFLCLAPCCIVLRCRWYQSGIKRPGAIWRFWLNRIGAMQVRGYEHPRTHLPRHS